MGAVIPQGGGNVIFLIYQVGYGFLCILNSEWIILFKNGTIICYRFTAVFMNTKWKIIIYAGKIGYYSNNL